MTKRKWGDRREAVRAVSTRDDPQNPGRRTSRGRFSESWKRLSSRQGSTKRSGLGSQQSQVRGTHLPEVDQTGELVHCRTLQPVKKTKLHCCLEFDEINGWMDVFDLLVFNESWMIVCSWKSVFLGWAQIPAVTGQGNASAESEL